MAFFLFLKSSPFIEEHPYEHAYFKCLVQKLEKKKSASYSKAKYQIALESYNLRGHEF